VADDIALLAGKVRAVRSYAAIGGEADLPALAHAHGLRLWQGIWLGSHRVKNTQEMAAGIALANRYPDTIDRLIVCNEVLLRRDLPVEDLIDDIDAVRRAVKQTVTYADVRDYPRQFPQIAPHVDVVTIHLLAYWEDDPTGIDGAMREVANVYRRSIALLRQEGFEYNLIETFDQHWQHRSAGTVGANWGLWTADRTPKFRLSGPIEEDPYWRAEAAILVLLGLVLGCGCTTCPWVGVAARHVGDCAWLGPGLGPDRHGADHLRRPPPPLRRSQPDRQALLAVLLLDRTALRLGRHPVPMAAGRRRRNRNGTGTVTPSSTRLPLRTWLRDALAFAFPWTVAVMQLLPLFDPRYRDLPLPVFIVPLIATITRSLLADLPRHGNREALWAGGTLAVAAVASAIKEGPLNLQSLTCNVAALALRAPVVSSALHPVRVRVLAWFSPMPRARGRSCLRLRCSWQPPPSLVPLPTPRR
jgi:hypothetical protein